MGDENVLCHLYIVLYCTIIWNIRDRGASEMNHHQPHQGWSSSKEGNVVYMVGLERSPLL